jgi:hypothetical protein
VALSPPQTKIQQLQSGVTIRLSKNECVFVFRSFLHRTRTFPSRRGFWELNSKNVEKLSTLLSLENFRRGIRECLMDKDKLKVDKGSWQF